MGEMMGVGTQLTEASKLTERFDRYYRDNYVKVYRLAFGLVNRNSSVSEKSNDAEEIAQEAFLRAFRSFGTFRGESSFFTWICRITMNVANDYMRQRGQLRIYDTLEELGCTEEELMDPNPANDPETRLLANEVVRVCMYGFTECLPIKQKKAFFLVVGFGLSYKRAAEILECSEGALKTILHRAKGSLAGYMESRCSLINRSNPCRCEQWVDACLAHNRITRECITKPTATIAVPDKVKIYMRDLRDIYRNVYGARSDEEMAEMLKEGFEKKRWATFT
jgi:RNA polymerase sigma-70 factor (ECF subfamily)